MKKYIDTLKNGFYYVKIEARRLVATSEDIINSSHGTVICELFGVKKEDIFKEYTLAISKRQLTDAQQSNLEKAIVEAMVSNNNNTTMSVTFRPIKQTIYEALAGIHEKFNNVDIFFGQTNDILITKGILFKDRVVIHDIKYIKNRYVFTVRKNGEHVNGVIYNETEYYVPTTARTVDELELLVNRLLNGKIKTNPFW